MFDRHSTFFIEKIESFRSCDEWKTYLIVGTSYEPPFEIYPTRGEHDFNKCKCCKKNLNILTNQFKAKFDGNNKKLGFPFCCTWHSNLIKLKEYNRMSFENAPELAAKKIIYTIQHIINNHKSNNWHREITDYIDWAIDSFGKMPFNCGEPLYLSGYISTVIKMIQNQTQIPLTKQKFIIDFLNSYKTLKNESEGDLATLYDTYNKWIELFPFELKSYFGDLKNDYKKVIPLFDGIPQTNLYSGETKGKIHTKSSLFESLLKITDRLLVNINGVSLLEKGLITDVNKIKLEVIINARKFKLKQGYYNHTQDEHQRFRNMITDWFEDEKKFFDEITPILKDSPLQELETKTEKLKKVLNEYGLFKLQTVKQLSEPNQQKLFELICTNDLPYIVAMFDYLGYLQYLENEHFPTKYKLNIEVAKWFKTNERTIKGNISSLLKNSNEDKNRYTAYLHKEAVKSDYQKLK